ncbi:hypothetical protein TVH25_06965 [Rhodococcus sp. 7Tela_A2]|uniref:hypothetical protein n=1 Tax=Rhodococcus sp. 7Tela_A2 TaxID=3093744 RepID=UPI003BB4DCB2
MPAPASTNRHRRWERLGLAGLVLAVVTAGVLLVVAPADSADTDQTTRTELQSLVDRWADAVRRADRDALASVIDPAATALLESETLRAESLRAVPLADFGYEMGPEPDLDVPTTLTAAFGADPVRAHIVYLRYAVDGVDEEPTRRPVTALFVERSGGWLLADDAPVIPGAVTWRGPWDHGPLHVAEVATAGGRSLVIGPTDRHDLIEATATELDSAVDAVSEVWGEEWSRRALVVATGSREEFTHQVGTRHDGEEIAAVAVSDAVRPGTDTATGQRIVFAPDAGERLTRQGLRALLRHEMVHIATRTETVDGSPLWVLEGYADYIGYRGTGTDPGGGVTANDLRRIAPTLVQDSLRNGLPRALPDDAEFTAGQGARSAYEKAWSVAAFTAEEFGVDSLTSLYRALSTGPAEPDEVDDALREVVGLGTGDYVGRWGNWVSERLTVG